MLNKLYLELKNMYAEILNVEEVHLDSNFFNLGADSLDVMELVSAINKTFNVNIDIDVVFTYPEVSDLGTFILELDKSEDSNIVKTEESPKYVASSAQKRMYVLNQYETEEAAYNISKINVVKGKLDYARLEKAVELLLERHEILRTSFRIENDTLMQIIHDKIDFNIDYLSVNKENNIYKIIQSFVKPYNLEQVPLMKLGILRLSEQEHLLILDIHHIIADEKSINILFKELASLYEGSVLPELSIQYKDFAAWQYDQYTQEAFNEHRAYWHNQFADKVPVLNFPTDIERPLKRSFKGAKFDFEMNESLFIRSKEFSLKNGITLYMFLLSAYYLLLHKYSSDDDIIVGVPISGRTHFDTEKMIGMFVNTLAMRNRPTPNKKYLQFLEEVKSNSIHAYQHQDYPFDMLVDFVESNKNQSRNPLFDTTFLWQYNEDATVDSSSLKIYPSIYENGISKFDMTLQGIEYHNKVLLSFLYSTDLFNSDTISKLATHFVNIIEDILINPTKIISDISVLSNTERREIISGFNDNEKHFPLDESLQSLFEIQVEKTPDEIAVHCDDEELTYLELNHRANRLARQIRKIHSEKNKRIIPIILERSCDAVTSMLGVLKTGHAYLPIDSDYPPERIKDILSDSSANIVITNLKNKNLIKNYVEHVVLVDDWSVFPEDRSNLDIKVGPNDPAYTLYTSGSTGKPKGIVIQNRSVVNLIFGLKHTILGEKGKRMNVALVAPFIFDASIPQIYGSLIFGHKLYITSKEVRGDGKQLLQYYEKNNINISDGTPTHLSLIEQQVRDTKQKLTLDYFLVGGETLTIEVAKAILNKNENLKIVNLYGTTECCVEATAYIMEKDTIENLNVVPVGSVLPNQKVYVLDSSLNIVPVGVLGEIYIGGLGVGEGYLNNPSLTSESFIKCPYMPNEKLYKTGDIGKWDVNGNLYCYGRKDEQVKILGYRIELSDIENQLLKHEVVQNAAVVIIPDENGQKSICAYIKTHYSITIKELREFLMNKLPLYMIPANFVMLEQFPLTSSGKINKRVLPKPEQNMETGYFFEAPRNHTEEILVQVWEDILKINNISIEDNFYVIGGDSIKSIQIAARLQSYNITLKGSDIIKYPTIKQLSSIAKPSTNTVYQGIVTGRVELLPIQKWFFNQKLKDFNFYNQSTLIHRKDGFSVELVKASFSKIVEHHDALRMTYKSDDMHSIIQFNEPFNNNIVVEEIDLVNHGDANQMMQECFYKLASSININEGPIFKVAVFKTNFGDYIFITIHHLVVDGVSWRIILEDFSRAYDQLLNNGNIVLSEKTVSFQEWSENVYNYKEKIREEIPYWEDVEKNISSIRMQDNLLVGKREKITDALSSDYTDKLLKDVHRPFQTQINEILLIALARSVYNWISENKVSVILEGHGREDIFENIDISRTVGWFTSLFPVNLEISTEAQLSEQILFLKEKIRNIPNKGVGYGILRNIYMPSNANGEVEPNIKFNYLGQFEENIGLDMKMIDPPYLLDNRENLSEVSLSIVSIVIDQKFTFTFEFNTNVFSENEVSHLVKLYKLELINIIDYCTSMDSRYFSPSDFTYNQLSVDELNEISSLLGEIECEK